MKENLIINKDFQYKIPLSNSARHPIIIQDEEIVRPPLKGGEKVGNNLPSSLILDSNILSHSISNNVVESKFREFGESPNLTRTMPSQAFYKKEGVEIKFRSMPKEDSPVKLAKKILLGTMLGDSCLVATSPKKAYLKITHSDKQLEYLLWKARKLSVLVGSFCYRRQLSRFSNKPQKEGVFKTSMRTLSSKYLKHISDDFYKEVNKKRIKVAKLNVLNRLTPISIAMWYGDDGCLVWHRKYDYTKNIPLRVPVSIRLSTHCYTKEEVELMAQWFSKRFNIDFNLIYFKRTKKYILGTYGEGMRRFLELVSPYLKEIKCLSYKLDPNEERLLNPSAEHLKILELGDDMIRPPGKVGRPKEINLEKSPEMGILLN